MECKANGEKITLKTFMKTLANFVHIPISDGDPSYGQRQRDEDRRSIFDAIASETASRVVRGHYCAEGCVNLNDARKC